MASATASAAEAEASVPTQKSTKCATRCETENSLPSLPACRTPPSSNIANTNRKTEKPKPKPIDVAIVIHILAHSFAARESSAVTAWGVPVLRGKTTKRMPVQQQWQWQRQQQQHQHTIESFAQRCVYVIYYKRRHFASVRVHCAWANCTRVRNVFSCQCVCVYVCMCV